MLGLFVLFLNFSEVAVKFLQLGAFEFTLFSLVVGLVIFKLSEIILTVIFFLLERLQVQLVL